LLLLKLKLKLINFVLIYVLYTCRIKVKVNIITRNQSIVLSCGVVIIVFGNDGIEKGNQRKERFR